MLRRLLFVERDCGCYVRRFFGGIIVPCAFHEFYANVRAWSR